MTTKAECLTTIARRIAANPNTAGADRLHDLEAIADEYHRRHGTWKIDQLEPALFWSLVHRHSTTGCYRPESIAPTTTPATGRIATGDGRSANDHDLRRINLNGLDVALELIRIASDDSAPQGASTDHNTTATDDLAELVTTLRALTGEATEATLIAALRQLVTDYLPAMLDPAATAEFLIELSAHNDDRAPGAQAPYIRPTRCLPTLRDTAN